MINWKNSESYLSNLKSKTNKLNVDKLVPATIDLIELIDVVKNDIVKTMYILLISKILQIIYLPLLN